MISSPSIQKASASDYAAICNLLTSLQLPTEDIDRSLPHFFVMKDGEKIIGVIALELFDQYGLLRSMATDPAYRNRGIASHLIETLLHYATGKGLQEMYLLTETAEGYFARKGFVVINRQNVPEIVKQSSEFSHVCPSTAVVMKKEIS